MRTPPIARLAALLCFFVGLGLLAACGDDAGPAPTPDQFVFPDKGNTNPCANCNGCCLNGQTCMPGNTEAACGFGGLACQVCGSTDLCISATCQPQTPQCSAATCADGCCDATSGTCIKPPTDAKCGLGGATCQACGSDEECKTGACTKKGPVTYEVIVVSAEVKNSDCGFNDDCDAYAEVALGGGAVVKTPDVDGSETPKWDFKLFDATSTELLATKLTVTIKDNDGALNPDDTLGTCELTVTQTDLDAGTLVSDCTEKVKNLTFSFKKKSGS
jgi:hypothetical protein